MKKKPGTKRPKAPKSELKNLSPRNAGQVKAGKSVNPIVIARDRTQNT